MSKQEWTGLVKQLRIIKSTYQVDNKQGLREGQYDEADGPSGKICCGGRCIGSLNPSLELGVGCRWLVCSAAVDRWWKMERELGQQGKEHAKAEYEAGELWETTPCVCCNACGCLREQQAV